MLLTRFKVCSRVMFLLGIRQSSTMTQSKTSRYIEERKIQVNNMDINFVRVGTGDHPLLLLPGALGTIWTHFGSQIENLDTEKLTIVAWDPPGYGESRPPARTFPNDFLQRDATWAHNLMKALGYSKFSLLGFSDGGTTALLFAAMYPESIRKMIVVSTKSYIDANEAKLFQDLRDINNMTKNMRINMIRTYGENYFKQIWSDLTDVNLKLYNEQNGDLCKQALPKIKCPTLIIHGNKDVMAKLEHSTYLKQKIVNSKLHIFDKGTHNLHIKYADKFNNLVTDFLLDSEIS